MIFNCGVNEWASKWVNEWMSVWLSEWVTETRKNSKTHEILENLLKFRKLRNTQENWERLDETQENSGKIEKNQENSKNSGEIQGYWGKFGKACRNKRTLHK